MVSMRAVLMASGVGVGVSAMIHDDTEVRHQFAPRINASTAVDPTCAGHVTVYDTTTVVDAVTLSSTQWVDIVVNKTIVNTYEECVTITNTSTVVDTVTQVDHSVKTDWVTITDTDVNTITDLATITDFATVVDTETETKTATVQATITTYTTTTIYSTSINPCPTECSISAETVNLYYFPTNRPYTYPSTYFDEALDYTFTSPSVYILIPTAKGVGSAGPTGPSTSSWMVKLDIDEVSTIVGGTLTQQLYLSDLRTDCPQTAEASAIATMVDMACDPILAAPSQVKSWAYPCNACGHFGLFDPPYAVPTVTSGLLGSTTIAPMPSAPASTTVPAPTSTPAEGEIIVVDYANGTPVATQTIYTTGVTGVISSSVEVSAPASPSSPPPATPSSAGITPVGSPSTVPTPAGSAGVKLASGLAWVYSAVAVAMLLL